MTDGMAGGADDAALTRRTDGHLVARILIVPPQKR